MTLERPAIVLASASPRRADLLRREGISFEVIPAHIDEALEPGEDPHSYVRRVAEAKGLAVVPFAGDRLVLSADTTVVCAGEILAKPVDRADAARMLRLLSGKAHEVVTAVALVTPSGIRSVVDSTIVVFRALSDAEIAEYVATGEPDDKAGSYAIQGGAADFVVRIEGSHSNVVGLPMEAVRRLLKDRDKLI